MSNTGQAWVTLATNDSYALGALVLAQSLKRNNTIHQLAVLITPGVSPSMREALSSVFDVVREVDVLDSQDAANLALLERPDLGVTFTKLHCWNLTQYTKCVFLDADTLVVKNSDELFERDELSAAPDAGWPDCFNSGVFVFTPSEATFKSLLEFALTNGSFDGGDQGLLNMYFGDWATKDITKHLPFIYNMVATATYSYLPAFKAFGGNVKIAHFIGSSKPWLQALPSGSTLSNFLDLWWDIFLKDVSKKLDTNMGGLAGALAGGQRDVIEDQFRKQSWEQGNIDYMGKDAFENIWKKMSETVDDIKPLETPAPETPALETPAPETPAPETPSTPEESAPAPETPKTEDKTDSSEVETQQISAPPVETPQLKVEEPQQEAPKVEPVSETATVDEAVEPPKPDAPQQPTDAPKAEEKPKEVSKPAALPAEAAPAQPAPEVKPESESAPSAAGEATLQDQAVSISIPPLSVATEAPAPAAVEPLPAAATESDVSAPIVVPQPPTPTVEPPTPPLPEPAKDPSTPPPAEKKEASPPKDAAPEKVAAPLQEPVAPASPSTPSPASPSAPEGTKIDSTQAPLPPDPQTPTAETSSPPQTPVGDAPVPPKRSSKKGKAKK